MLQLLIPIACVFIHIMHVLFVLHYLSVGMAIALVFTKSRCSHTKVAFDGNTLAMINGVTGLDISESVVFA